MSAYRRVRIRPFTPKSKAGRFADTPFRRYADTFLPGRLTISSQVR